MTNLLSLEEFRREMGFHPWHFWGLANSTVPVNNACDDTVKQYSWQNSDAVGREDIVKAIETAEQRLHDYLGYWPAPKYGYKQVKYPTYIDVRVRFSGYEDGNGRWTSVATGENYLQAIGVEQRTLLATCNVTYSDPDGDGLNELFTFTVATIKTEVSKLAFYFAAANRLDGEAVSDKYRIKPVNVVISGGVATVKGSSWLLVRPILYEGASTADLNPATAGNFVTTVEAYTRVTNPQGITLDDCQVRLEWETAPYPWFATLNTGSSTASVVDGGAPNTDYSPLNDNGSTDPAAMGMAVGRAGIRDSRLGHIIPSQAVYNVADAAWYTVDWANSTAPDTVTVRYNAGIALDSNGHMKQELRTLVARMAAAELARPICACDTASRELYRWQFDLGRIGGADDERYSVSQMDLENPFGTRRGHVWSWKYTKQKQVAEAFLA